ncbi:MAG: glutamate--tRNA ligase, partial [Candidatus Aenigmatarchaeota archaeon]
YYTMTTVSYGGRKGKDDAVKMLALKCSLQNAVQHGGKASVGAVMGKMLGEQPELRGKIGTVRHEAENAVRQVNFISATEQKRRLEKLAPVKEEKKGKERPELPELKDAKMNRVVTRFAPCPSGPLNILQVLRALMLSYLYAEKYNGRFILRFEDTDPSPGKIKKEFYDMIREDMRFLGAKQDDEITESKNMPVFYRYAEKLIEGGHAYVDFTPAEEFRKLKNARKDPEFRSAAPEENMKAWKDMLNGKYRAGEAVLRFKTSMKDPNPAFRDPAIFRIARGDHPLVGNRFCVWPLYNFANSVEDHESGVTHIFRGKEHEHNSYIQNKIYAALGWEPPTVLNFGMIYLPGKKEHTRDIKEKISKGEYTGWDDPRLHTIAALRRRGFRGEAFREVAITAGPSKSDIKFSWDSLETANRRLIDPNANRYMVVFDPVKISLRGYPHKTNFVREPLHPDFPRRGNKRMWVDTSEIMISKDDWKALKGKEFRLKGLANIKLSVRSGNYTGNELKRSMKKIQWVSRKPVDVELTYPDGDKLKIWKGLGETAMNRLKPGEIIQMERIGFAIVESNKSGRLKLLWTHK